MGEIKERFDRADSVRIVGDETDLTLGIEGREGVVSAGFRNMPDGEVFYSPVEDSAEGVITYAEFPAVYLGHDVVGARLVFREGKVVEASADEGEEFLKQILATDEGASRLGELGLGCNPRITKFTRNVLFDEKIDGTVHLAVGASYTYTGGKNESAVHWDMVKDLRPGRRDLGRRRNRPARRRLADLAAQKKPKGRLRSRGGSPAAATSERPPARRRGCRP